MDSHTPPSKRSLLRRLKGWFGSDEKKSAAHKTAEQPVHEPVVEMPANPVESVITPELTADPQQEHAVHVQKSPVVSPKAVRRKRISAPKTKDIAKKEEIKPLRKSVSARNLLDILPAETNLIGRSPVEIMIADKKHVLAFRNEHIILDGNNYHINKGSVTLDIENVKRDGSHLNIVIGAFGKTETLVFASDDMEEIFSALLTHGTYKNEDQELVITRF